MPEFNPFGQMLQSRMASDQFNQQKQRNAMSQQLQERQLAQFDQKDAMSRLELVGKTAPGFLGLPQEQQVAGFDMYTQRLNSIMPGTVPEGMQYGPEALQHMNQAVQTYQSMQAPQDQYEGLSGGYETYLRANQIPNSPEAYNAYQKNVLAQKKAGATQVTVGTQKVTPGRKKADEAFAKEYVAWNASGGYADVEKQIGQLDEVVRALGSGRDLTGPITGSIPEFAQKFINPEALAVKDAVEEVVQRNLRLVLGAQFTEKEGARLIARAYNPNLSEAENKKRVTRLINQIKSAAQAKQSASNYWERHGTLTGWNGKTYTMNDFLKVNPEVEEKTETKSEAKPTGGIKFLGFE